jgi:hypothetical protein
MLSRPVYILITGGALLLLASLALVRGVAPIPYLARGSIQSQSDMETATGTFRIVDPVTEQCRQIVFSNVTAKIIETSKSCGSEKSAHAGGRLEGIKRSFFTP